MQPKTISTASFVWGTSWEAGHCVYWLEQVSTQETRLADPVRHAQPNRRVLTEHSGCGCAQHVSGQSLDILSASSMRQSLRTSMETPFPLHDCKHPVACQSNLCCMLQRLRFTHTQRAELLVRHADTCHMQKSLGRASY